MKELEFVKSFFLIKKRVRLSFSLFTSCLISFYSTQAFDNNAKSSKCFKGYADIPSHESDHLDERKLLDCLCTILNLGRSSECINIYSHEKYNAGKSIEAIVERLKEKNTKEEGSELLKIDGSDYNNAIKIPSKAKKTVSDKAVKLYCDEDYCSQDKGKLSQSVCKNLKKIATNLPCQEHQNVLLEECSVSSLEKCRDYHFAPNDDYPGTESSGGGIGIQSTGEKPNDNNPTEHNPGGKKTADNKPVDPLGPESDGDPVSPFFSQSTLSGGDNPLDDSSVDPLSSVGGDISRSQARVPGIRVNEPGSINAESGAAAATSPLDLMDFPTRGERPGGTPKQKGDPPGGGLPPGGPGLMGGPGGMGMGGAASQARGASSKRKRRRRGGSFSQSSPRYMGAPQASRGGTRRHPPSAMNQKVRKKMEENRKKNFNKQNINALLQKRLRGTGPSHTDTQSFTPVFYFPDIEKVYKDLNNQSQFLNSKGREL